MHVTWPLTVPPDCPFPISNIPFGIFSPKNSTDKRAGTAIGDLILDLSSLEQHGVFFDCLETEKEEVQLCHSPTLKGRVFNQETLNGFASLPAVKRSAFRNKIIALLEDGNSVLYSDPNINSTCFWGKDEVEMYLPMQIGDFTDFMCSRTHVDNILTMPWCSRMAGVSTPPSFYAMPTAYNGRASSVVISGTPVHRPRGMLHIPASSAFEFAPSRRMDYELEMGFFVSKPIPFGKILKGAEDAREHIFGFVMLNDWSARDIQFAEMTPLGPFNGKGCATTISPWVVTLDALVGAEVEMGDYMAREEMGKVPSHLSHRAEKPTWNINVEVALKRESCKERLIVASSNLADLYWSPSQMLSHHASSGCGMRTGDLLGTGTISSPRLGTAGTSSLGCLHEATEAGLKPFTMSNGKPVTWLEDGDEVILTGKIIKSNGTSLGFGDCGGQLKSAF